MVAPIIAVIVSLGYIVKTGSLLHAICELNLDVVHHILLEMHDAKLVIKELREKMLVRLIFLENK